MVTAYAEIEFCKELANELSLMIALCLRLYAQEEVGSKEPEAERGPWVACASCQLSPRKTEPSCPALVAADVPGQQHAPMAVPHTKQGTCPSGRDAD